MFRFSVLCIWIALVATVSASDAIPVEAEKPFWPEGRPLEGLVITLDAGHGGSAHQPGYSGSARGVETRVVEGDLNIKVTLLADHFLRAAGAQVHLTRRDDRKVTLGDTGRAEELGARTQLADETASHLFLSLHHNSTGRRTANGVVILIWPTDSQGNEQPLETAFATILEEEMKKFVPWDEDFNFYLNEHPLAAGSDIPSAVMEFGFLSNPEFDAWVVRPDSAIIEAEGIYNAVVRMWAEHRDELEAKRAELFPDAPPARQPASRDAMRGVAERLWPAVDPPETPAQVRQVIDLWKRTQLSDHTTLLVEIDVRGEPGAWNLSGRVSHAILRDAVVALVREAGGGVGRASIEVLPSERLGVERYGVVQIPMALTWGRPAEGDWVQSQLLMGDPVWLLDETEDGTYIRLHGPEGYIGWVRREAIRRMTARDFAEWFARPAVVTTRAFHINDVQVPAGAWLPFVADAPGSDNDDDAGKVTIELPRSFRATGGETMAQVSFDDVRFRAGDPGRAIAEAAISYIHTPYLFGGRSPQGLDCSGLTGMSVATAGVVLPRDAFQQAMVGRLVATAWNRDSLRPGDLLFFIDRTGRVIHSAVSIGGSRFVHASPPAVQVNSFDSSDPLYHEGWTEAFAFARRVLP